MGLQRISRYRYPASLLARRLDLQKTRHVVSIHCCVTSLRTWETQHFLLLLLVRVYRAIAWTRVDQILYNT
jgi:hypothetical protein